MKHAIFFGILLASSLGCGRTASPWGSVTGTIAHKGKPVDAAIVLFSNRDAGVEITAETDARGHFTMRTDRIAGLPIGTYKVVVTPKPVGLPTPQDGMMFKEPAPLPVSSAIPAAYRDVKTTRLTAAVQTGQNEFQYNLQ
jgi:hypothetical protein